MPIIHELSSHLADLIAAGEVVERPASVAKELIENAIDAGSTRITIEIENGGITYLRITDNGCGMSAEDAPIAFRRHATSKLRSAEDLTAIGTLGFRGEALAAIASVSRIDLFTKQSDTLAGIHLHLEAGQLSTQEEAGCPDGTTIIVRDLFYNTPARMKFLRKDFTEAGYVVSIVQHSAMSHPEIAFTFIRDGKQIFATPGKGKLIAPVFLVFGKDMTEKLIEVQRSEKDHLAVWGYITKPHAGRSNRSMQYFFVNGRYIKSRVMQAALEEAYRNKIIVGKYPSCAIFLTIPLHMVDVNVHPAKTEVKFAAEKSVFDAVYVACKNTLEQDDNIPQIKAHPERKIVREDTLTQAQQRMEIPVQDTHRSVEQSAPIAKETLHRAPAPIQQEAQPAPEKTLGTEQLEKKTEKYPVVDTYQVMGKTIKVRSVYPEQRRQHLSLRQTQHKQPYVDADELDWDYLPQIVPPETKEQTKQSAASSTENTLQGGARVIGEAFETYIVAEDAQGLILIDKHAAHERIIFNQLRERVDIPRQALLSAVVIEVTAVEAAALTEQLDKIRQIGFDLDTFGQNSFMVREIPAYLDCGNLQQVFSEMADKLMNHRVPIPDRLDDLIHTVACKSAIKAGTQTSFKELQDFCNRVLEDPNVVCCPHGRPVTVRLTKYELDKMFKRVNQ